ncbi:hypothetical protein EDD15DRAFT_2166674 [Pisolithus albus]|nr:hypothetical protein EDD15DRAFT_2166674 [Pisolithus albus]
MTRPRTHQPYHSGEKLPLSLAGTILKRPEVLLMDMDEALLHAVSTTTDALINKIIRSKFSTSTILMFTRRPLTVIDYFFPWCPNDLVRIMILDAGRVFEPGRPSTLIADRNSRFCRMCKSAGREGLSILKKWAGVASPTPFEVFWLCRIRDARCGSYHTV